MKINTVLIPGVNDKEILEIAKEYNVYKMNIMPIIPQGEYKSIDKPDNKYLNLTRKNASKYIQQIDFLKQCRADACGIPALEK